MKQQLGQHGVGREARVQNQHASLGPPPPAPRQLPAWAAMPASWRVSGCDKSLSALSTPW